MIANRGKSWVQTTSANGTEGRTDWNAVNWQQVNRRVRNLRQRIFRASRENDLKRVRSLANGKLRPLGIPTIRDRALQARVKNALEPFWEARFEPCSYGFRPGRGCHDAIARIYGVAAPTRRRKWVLDADIKGFLDPVSYCPLVHEASSKSSV